MDEERQSLSGRQFAMAVLIGPIGGLLLVALPYFLIARTPLAGGRGLPHLEYGYTFLLMLPLIQSGLGGFAIRSTKALSAYTAMGLTILAIDYALAFVIVQEGVICLLMAAPLYAVIIVSGLGLGYLLARLFQRRALQVSLLPLAVLAVVYDAKLPPPVFANAISDAVTINASPAQVWRYIVEYPENNKPPEYWLWQIGLPLPIQSTASGAFVGAQRHCRFTDNIAFEEEITELVPNKNLTFKVTAQPDHPEIIGHFSLDKGQLYLEANADGTTTVIATSWYRIFVRPASYFDWWASDIVRNVHFRVLNHMKELAEADKLAGMPRHQ
jgi:uncharacterized protein YndB with AHSA1/START domain